MRTLNLRRILQFVPEILLLSVALFMAIENLVANGVVNYPMLLLVAFVSTMLLTKNKYMALLTSVVIGAGSLYMVLAVLSEYYEFPTGDANGSILLLIGLSICFAALVLAAVMPIKYFSRK